jgi:serine/threonine protein kinase
MIGIKALTGMTPHEIERDANGELKWVDKAYVSHSLSNILTKMVREDFQQRYQSASAALEALQELLTDNTQSLPNDDSSLNTLCLEEPDIATTPWTGISDNTTQSTSSTSILPTYYKNSIKDRKDFPPSTK